MCRGWRVAASDDYALYPVVHFRLHRSECLPDDLKEAESEAAAAAASAEGGVDTDDGVGEFGDGGSSSDPLAWSRRLRNAPHVLAGVRHLHISKPGWPG